MQDLLVRAIGADGQIRVFAGVTTNLIEDAQKRHKTSRLATAALGRVITCGAMMGQMLKEGQEVVLQVMGDGPLGSIFVEADDTGNVRGYIRHPEVELDLNELGKLDVARGVGEGMLYVIKDLGLKEPYKGSVPLVSGEIGEDLTYYFTKSEQLPSAVGVGVLVSPDQSVLAAGGFIVQLLPHAEEETIARLEENLGNFRGGVTSLIEVGKTAEDLVALLLNGFEYQITDQREVRFKCKCNRTMLERVVVNLGEEEARDILQSEGILELTCHFCNRRFTFAEVDLDWLFGKKGLKTGQVGETPEQTSE